MLETSLDAGELAKKAAHLFLALSRDAVAQNEVFSVALSGGSTPRRLYELLADPTDEFSGQLSWDRTHFFFTDERHVSPDHPDSNFRMVNEAMLAHVPVPSANVHRMLSEKPNPEESASEYEAQLRRFFDLGVDALPRFDLALLGLGTDGHTASIFPGLEASQATRRLVVAPWVEKLNSYRLTMTLPVLNNAATNVFLVSGAEKATILSDVLEGAPDRFPAQAIRPTNGDLIWLVDQAAAGKLVNLFSN